jgi:putative ABC transport system permease protein
VTALLAWRILSHEQGRSGLAVGGILVAILLMFLQIGFYSSVPRGGLLFYDAMNFDLMLTSSAYVFEAQPKSFPRRRLLQAIAIPEVTRAVSVYHASGRWLNSEQGLARDVFVIGYNPEESVFKVPEIAQATDTLRQADTILVDASSRHEFGELKQGRRVEIQQRTVNIGGIYHLGSGFVGLGVAITSDINFSRLFPEQGGIGVVNLGLLTLATGTDQNAVAGRLRAVLPADTQVFTRQEITDHEISHWVTNTSTGLIFGFGVIVAIIVGLVILNQTLSTQITRQLPQYATLKAIGYTDRQLGGIVLTIATALSTISYIPALALSILIYWIIRKTTPLPIEMTWTRMLTVLAVAWLMSAMSALISLRVLRRADPVELF